MEITQGGGDASLSSVLTEPNGTSEQEHSATEWDGIAQLYDSRFGEHGDAARQVFYDPLVRSLLGDIDGKTVLDAGCGNGYWSRMLSGNGANHVIGIDPSRELLKLAKAKDNPSNVHYAEMDLGRELAIGSGAIDAIVSNLVLDYVPKLDVFAKESSRILRPEGDLVIGVQHPLYHMATMMKDGEGVYQRKVGYFENVPVVKKTFEGEAEVTIHNRTVSDYINSFIKNGLNLVEMQEPQYSDELVEEKPSLKDKRDIPRFLLLKFQKPKE